MKNVFKRSRVIIITVIMLIMAFFVFQNNHITISKYDYIDFKIPEDFHDFIIAHISDLHNKEFGKNQKTILTKLKDIKPDAIVITGDLIDRRRYDLETAMTFVEGAIDIAPVFYVSGNHEAWSGKYTRIEEELKGAGAQVLDNSVVRLSIENSSLLLFGLRDPDFLTSSYDEGTDTTEMIEQFDKWSPYKGFKILLSHRSELFHIYCEHNMDLIFAGHAHGGQVRVPLVGGLIAPDQGLLPKYTAGSYKVGESTMYVSRGLGNSVFPLRMFNRPEIVVVTLKTKG